MFSVSQKQDWQNRLKLGKVESVTCEVEAYLKKADGGEKLALSLLCIVSNTVTESSVHLKGEEVYYLCHMCCEAVKVESLNTDTYKFVCCVYHIVKYLLKQKSVEAALKLSNFILSTNCDVNDEATSNVYYNYYWLFYQLALSKKQENESSPDVSVIWSFLMHSLKFLKCCIGNYLKYFLERAIQFLASLKLKNDENHIQIVQMQIEILDLTYCKDSEWCKNIQIEDAYRLYVCCLIYILKSIIDAKYFSKAEYVLKKTVDCMSTWIGKDSVSNDCMKLLRDVLFTLLKRPCGFENKIRQYTKALESLVFKYSESEILNWTCMTIVRVLYSMILYWTSEEAEEWNLYMTVGVQEALFEFIVLLSERLVASKCIKCVLPSGEECSVNNDTATAINILFGVIQCASLSLSCKTDGFAKVLPDVVIVLNDAVDKIMILKAGNCPLWEDMWKKFGTKIYNLGVYCHSSGLLHEAKVFFSKYCWTCIQLGKPALSEEGSKFLSIGMQNLIRVYQDTKKFRGALRVVVIALIILPDFKKKFLYQWTKTKTCAQTENCKSIESLTICDIITEDKVKIEIVCPDTDLGAIDIPQLLVWELEAYSLSSLSSLNATQSAYEKLRFLSPERYILQAQGLLLYLPSVWVNGNVEQCADVIPSIKSIMDIFRYEDESPAEMEKLQHLCLHGNLYYWLFLCQLKVTRSKQEEEILSSNIIPTKLSSQQEDNHDPLATCDVTPAYRYLNIENEQQTLEALNKALEIWMQALKYAIIAAAEFADMLSNIEVAAYVYELYGYDTQKLKCWCLYYKIAELIDKKEAMLLGLCNLSVWCTCGMEECKWLIRAQDLVSVLHLEENKEYNSQLLLHKFWFSSSCHCFRNEKFMKIVDFIEALVEFTKIEKIQYFSHYILYVRVMLLVSQLKCLPWSYTVTWPSRNEKTVYNEAIYTYQIALSLLKQAKMTPAENAQVLNLMLEVSQWLGRLCLDLFWPREARCFMKSDLILAQKLGLVTRTTQFLSLLAQVDMMCCNVDDCQVKVQGMEMLLQLESRFQVNSTNHKKVVDEELSSHLEQLTLEKQSQEMAVFRDIPRINGRSRSPLGSPVLQKMSFVLPGFLSHQNNCHCYMCNTLTLQTLMLDITFIQAQIYNIQSDLKEALQFFEGGLQLARLLVHKQTKLVNKIDSEVHQLILDCGSPTDCFHKLTYPLKLGFIQVMIGYADFLAASGFYARALDLNMTVIQEMEKLKFIHPHLAANVMEQNFCILQAKVDTANKQQEKCVPDSEDISLQVTDAGIRTPVNTHPLPHRALFTVVSSNFNKEGDSPFKIKLRRLVLPSNDKENKLTMNSKSVKKATKTAAYKLKQTKTTSVYEDSCSDSQDEKLPSSHVKVNKIPARTKKLTSESSAKLVNPKHKVKSLSCVRQTLEFRNNSPENYFQTRQSSNRNRKQNTSTSNSKIPIINIIEPEIDDDSDDEVFESAATTKLSSECTEESNKHTNAGVFQEFHTSEQRSSRPLRTYSKQNIKTKLEEKNIVRKVVTSDKTMKKCTNNSKQFNSINIVQTATLNKGSRRIIRNRACSSGEDSVKISHVSARSARQTRDRGKTLTTGSNESSRPGNSVETIITDIRNLALEPDIQEIGTKGKVDKTKKKGKEFLFTPSGKTRRKEFDETIVPSSSPESEGKTEPEVYSSNQKVLLTSSEDEILSDLKIKVKDVRSTAKKKKRLAISHRFILN